MRKALCLKVMIVFFLVVTTLSCRNEEGEGNSAVKYLINGIYTCREPSEERLNYIKKFLPAEFITRYSAEGKEMVYRRLAGIPDTHLSLLVNDYQRGVFEGVSAASSLGSAAGITQLTYGTTKGGFRGLVARGIQTLENQVDFALQHEIGHAVEILAQEAASQTGVNYDTSLKAALSEYQSKGSIVRAYAKSNLREAFAEAYANFYCSEESTRFIEQNLPQTFIFLRKVLPLPLWEANRPDPEVKVEVSQIAVADDSFKSNGTPPAIPPSTVTDGGTYTGEEKIFVRVIASENKTDGFGLRFASTPKILQIVTCLGSEKKCIESNKKPTPGKYLEGGRLMNQRRFYPPQFIKDGQISGELTLLGFDGDGAMLGSRSFKISESGG